MFQHVTITSLDLDLKVLRTHLTILLTLVTILSIWIEKEQSFESWTPRSLKLDLSSIYVSNGDKYTLASVLLSVLYLRHSNFLELNSRPTSCAQR